MMIKSTRHIVKFYLVLIGAVCFFLIMSVFVFMLLGEALSKTGEVVMMLMGLALVSGAVYIIIRYVKNAPSIEINDQSITINSKKYLWSDLEKAEMTGKKRFKALNGNSKEATTLLFKNNKEVYFFDDMYSNSAEMKRFIDQVVVKKQAFEQAMSMGVIGSQAVNESFVYFKGYQLFCIDGIIMWVFLLPGIYMLVRFLIALQVGGIVGFSIFTFGWLFLWGRRLFYFGVSDHYFVIRIHNFFWSKKNYLLSDIREVVFESHFREGTTCLRIITNDFESKLYPADSLWSKRWMELKQILEEKNIKVRNECVHYEPFEFKLYN